MKGKGEVMWSPYLELKALRTTNLVAGHRNRRTAGNHFSGESMPDHIMVFNCPLDVLSILYHMHYQSPATWCFLTSTSIIFDLSPVVPRSSSALTACSQTSSYMDSLVYLLATSLSALSRNLVMCLL
ncbi:hypothetical protein L226DRAFT_526685 [Lentinus tigrinus ALCF2SS1-7]|uniref:uncharacterized protein n=1 Tax=Lentinus tigrinus ALCF2SS1-7 TaxID=1328758 RepID=UPI001165EA97|nr:hypothetical protein L226DRAFT_526685 [Lentinus tigrinus ALCF2SS1-7]